MSHNLDGASHEYSPPKALEVEEEKLKHITAKQREIVFCRGPEPKPLEEMLYLALLSVPIEERRELLQRLKSRFGL